MAFTKINAAGIGTTETVTVDGLTVINNGSFGGNLTVSGVLTYEDVTNVDSVGLITARNGIVVGSGITLSKDGDIFATGITTVSGNVKVGTGITLSPDGDGFYTGVVTATSFSGSGANLTGIDTDLVSDTSPQLGGNLDVNTKNIVFGDSGGTSDDRLVLGAGSDLSIYHSGSHSFIQHSGTGHLILGGVPNGNNVDIMKAGYSEYMARFKPDSSVDLYYDANVKFQTTSSGVSVTGGVAASGGNITLQDSGSASDDRVALGAGGDLQLFHDGTNSVISNQTGDFYIENDSSSTSEKILIRAKAGESSINCNPNGAVELYYNDNKMFETLTDGVSVVGAELRFQGQASRIIKYRSGNNDMIYEGNSGFFMRQDIGNNRHEFFVGNSKITSVTGNGITFGSDTAAANALDDYEEGSWTPTLTNVFAAGTSSGRVNVYRKIGGMVYFTMDIFASASNMDICTSGATIIGGLPFTPLTSFNSSMNIAIYMNNATGQQMDNYMDTTPQIVLHDSARINNVRHLWGFGCYPVA